VPFPQKEISALPNDVLLNILKFCSGTDIVGFSEAYPTERIQMIAGEKSLWKNVSIGPNDLQKYMTFLGQHTKKITLLGIHTEVLDKKEKHKFKQTLPKNKLLPLSVVKNISIRCKSLTHLTLQNIALDTQVVKFSMFPESLESLSLNNVYLKNRRPKWLFWLSPFYDLCKDLPNLEFLNLQSYWYYEDDFKWLLESSKRIPKLVESRMPDCFTFNFDEGELADGEKRRICEQQAMRIMDKAYLSRMKAKSKPDPRKKRR